MELGGFKHIMENETRIALEQINIDTIPDLLNEPFDTINKLDYYPTITHNDNNQTLGPTKKQVARGSIRLLMIFIDFCTYRTRTIQSY